MKIKLFNLLLFILLLNSVAIAQIVPEIEPASGTEDKTIIWLTDFGEVTPTINKVKVNVLMADNNQEGDGDGGKIRLVNAEIMEIEKTNWEENCEDKNSFEFECIQQINSTIQWFNFAFNEQDSFSFTIRFPESGGSLILEETGGMECGAYFQTAQLGPYTGYPDGSGGLPCTAKKTFIWNGRVSNMGGFPVKINLNDRTINLDQPKRKINFLSIAIFVILIGILLFIIKYKVLKK